MKIKKKNIRIVAVIIVLVASSIISYRLGTRKVNDNAKKIVEQLNEVNKIDFDYINSLNALRQRTLEWGQIQAQIVSATGSAEQVQELRDSSDQAIVDIEKLTKLTLTFKLAREELINNSNK